MVKHCCYGFCRSDSRYAEREDMQGVFFISFPKPKTDPDKCVRWFLACGREDITLEKVKRDTYICSKHFIGGRGPTDSHPDPIPVPDEDLSSHMYSPSSKTKKRIRRPAELAKNLFGEHGEDIMLGKISSSSLGLGLGRLASLNRPEKRRNQPQQGNFEEPNKRIKLASLYSNPIDHDEDQTVVIKMEPTDDYEEETSSTLPSNQSSTPVVSQSVSASDAIQESHLVLPNNAPSSKRSTRSMLFRELSQSPAAVRVRRFRQRMIKNNKTKYEQLKEYDRKRAKEYRKNLTEEQKIRIRQAARERTRRFRLRKKLQALEMTGNAALYHEKDPRKDRATENRMPVIPTSQSGFSSNKNSAASSSNSETPPEMMILSSQPTIATTSTCTCSQHAPIELQTISMLHNSSRNTNQVISPRFDAEQQCTIGDSSVEKHWSNATYSVDTDVSPASQNVSTDVFMWAGPDMINQGTNTEMQSTPSTADKACQINVKCGKVMDTSSQTDLTLSDLGMFTDSQVADRGLGRRKFIVADVMHDDQSCSFYTGFSLVTLVWLFDWLKGSFQKDKSTNEERVEGESHKQGENHTGGLSHLEQFLLVMMWLRKGLDFELVGHLFGVTCNTVRAVCDTWLNVMQKQFRILGILQHMQNGTSTEKLNHEFGNLAFSSDAGMDDIEVSNEEMVSGVLKQQSRLNAANGGEYESMHLAEQNVAMDILFQRQRKVHFYLNRGNCINGSISRYSAKMLLSKAGIFNLVTQLSPNVTCPNKSDLNMRRSACKYKSKIYQLIKSSTGRTCKNGFLKRRISLRSPRLVARQQQVLKTRALRELQGFKVLQTMHPYSDRFIIRNAMKVCVSLSNVILSNRTSEVR